MRRFRFTIIAICLILSWLAYADLTLLVRNTKPKKVPLSIIEQHGPPQEWLIITGAYRDLPEAINMSGTMDIDSFLVPLKSTPDSQVTKLWVETRDPEILSALKTYYFELDNDEQRRRFAEQHDELFYGRTTVEGMLTSGLVANSNRDKLIKLLKETGVPVPGDVTFVSEGKEPNRWRGFFFAIIAIAGVLKLARDIKKEASSS